MQYIRSNDASFSIRFHSIQREEQSRRSSILGITPNNLINRGHGIASTEIGSLSSIEFIPIPKVFDRWTIMSLLNSKSFFVSIENILMQMIHKLESNFEHRSHSSWRRERVFLSLSSFRSSKRKYVPRRRSIYETIEAISLINRRIQSEIQQYLAFGWWLCKNWTNWIFSGWRICKMGRISERIWCEPRYYCSSYTRVGWEEVR